MRDHPQAAGELVCNEPAPVTHLGMDKHRRGWPRWRRDTDSGEYVQLANRWHTCFYDLSGNQGMLGQAEGRTADDAAYWLAGATPAGRDAVQVAAIDMCTIYLSAVRRMLPRAQVAVDLQNLSPDNSAMIIDTLDNDGEGQQIALAWTSEKKHRDALSLRGRVTGSIPCEQQYAIGSSSSATGAPSGS